MADKPAVLVVGGGVIGLACAFRLARDGQRVVLVDRAEPGREASFGNAGHIATEQVFPLASPAVIRSALAGLLSSDSPLRIRPRYALRALPWLGRFALAARAKSFERGTAAIASLLQTARQDLSDMMARARARELVHADGHLVLVEKVGSVAKAKSEVENMALHGVEAKWIDRNSVRKIAPELAPQIMGAWHFTGTGHVDDPFAVCQALEKAFRAAGGEVVEREIVDIENRGARLFARASAGDMIEAAHVVVACGAWSKALATRLGYPVPLDTERGYHVTLPAAAPAFRIPVASFERKVIMTPMTHGLRMTGTVELGGLELAPDPSRHDLLRRHLTELVPTLRRDGMTAWMGFRPSLPDHLPVLGRVPDGRNIYFAFGHQHLGLTLAGVTARVIGNQVQGREPGIDLEPFSPLRFAKGQTRKPPLRV